MKKGREGREKEWGDCLPFRKFLDPQVSEVKVKSNYFIVRPKVDQRAGLLSLPHLGIFAIHHIAP